MSFPLTDYPASASRQRGGHKALLASAIARQASGPTVCAMILAANNNRSGRSGTAMALRIHYFSSQHEGLSSLCRETDQPFGAFFPQLNESEDAEPKGESDVYHDGSTIGKAGAIELAPAEVQPEHAGHGVSKSYD